jgi:hypothetical protein
VTAIGFTIYIFFTQTYMYGVDPTLWYLHFASKRIFLYKTEWAAAGQALQPGDLQGPMQPALRRAVL